MANLFIFGIGGTGSRVLRSLLMLLAAGVDINADKIIPLIIDTDKNNGDFERFNNLIQFYRNINNSLYHNIDRNQYKNHFFRREIDKLKVLNIGELQYKSLYEMLDYGQLIPKGLAVNKYFIDLLYDELELSKDLEKGFYGKPNIGSLVLRDIVTSDSFKNFTQFIGVGDRIFIISSIFGGTGAAGYPLLLKIFRDQKQSFNNVSIINKSIIGAVSVLPYFEVNVSAYENGTSCINSATFITKTKAALSYYDRNIRNLVNHQYYVADLNKTTYENIEGGAEQKNDAHFIEVAAASSIIHFMNEEPEAKNIDDLVNKLSYGEFGIHENRNDKTLSLWNLYEEQNVNLFIKPMITFHLFNYLLRNNILNFDNKNITWIKEIGVNVELAFKDNLNTFCENYEMWLKELQNEKHQRMFNPFDLSKIGSNDILKAIRNLHVNNIINENNINFILNSLNDSLIKERILNPNLRFIRLIFEGLSRIYSEQKIIFPQFSEEVNQTLN
jgi:hypothetical protein